MVPVAGVDAEALPALPLRPVWERLHNSDRPVLFEDQECWRFSSSNSCSDSHVSLDVLQRPKFGIGGRVWEVSLLLVRVLEHILPRNVSPQRDVSSSGQQPFIASMLPPRCRVLELGSGCGLVGLVLASLGHDIVLTDTPAMQPLLRANITAWTDGSCRGVPRNAVSQSSEVQGERSTMASRVGAAVADILAWGDTSDALRVAARGPFDIIVGSDVTYLKHVRRLSTRTSFVERSGKPV
eukprot:TRINITY_DN56856_c0_g1_i2.p1 TRINITY_DN56856_c0_g1~~TRINITY_DN56856_c0_g1_i2.p1  ORF type:complete len:239 (+),score=26.08 TRINITY_DN56856_c0_g1_i2:67-783(+)